MRHDRNLERLELLFCVRIINTVETKVYDLYIYIYITYTRIRV